MDIVHCENLFSASNQNFKSIFFIFKQTIKFRLNCMLWSTSCKISIELNNTLVEACLKTVLKKKKLVGFAFNSITTTIQTTSNFQTQQLNIWTKDTSCHWATWRKDYSWSTAAQDESYCSTQTLHINPQEDFQPKIELWYSAAGTEPPFWC